MATIKDWLSNVYYDNESATIFNKTDDGKIQQVLDVRGWGRIQNLFAELNDAANFQDKVGEFIAEAIREKINKV